MQIRSSRSTRIYAIVHRRISKRTSKRGPSEIKTKTKTVPTEGREGGEVGVGLLASKAAVGQNRSVLEGENSYGRDNKRFRYCGSGPTFRDRSTREIGYFARH